MASLAQVFSRHDGYISWLQPEDLPKLARAPAPYSPTPPADAAAVQAAVPGVLAFLRAASAVPNRYLWGGTTAPNYDCSGLVQAAFGSQARLSS